MRYFASATNDWYSIWYCNYGRTWSITSLPGLFFAEGERFLSFWRCHRPRWGGWRWWCGVADSSLSLKPQTKGTVLLVCICQRHTKRTVPLVCAGATCISFPKKIGTAWWWGNPDFRVFKEMYVKSYILCARKINRFLRQLRSHPFRG